MPAPDWVRFGPPSFTPANAQVKAPASALPTSLPGSHLQLKRQRKGSVGVKGGGQKLPKSQEKQCRWLSKAALIPGWDVPLDWLPFSIGQTTPETWHGHLDIDFGSRVQAAMER